MTLLVGVLRLMSVVNLFGQNIKAIASTLNYLFFQQQQRSRVGDFCLSFGEAQLMMLLHLPRGVVEHQGIKGLFSSALPDKVPLGADMSLKRSSPKVSKIGRKYAF